MPRTILADTNILLDAAMTERPNHAYALLLFDEVVYGELVMRVTSTSYKDVYYVLTKYTGEAAARGYVKNLLRLTVPSQVDFECLSTAAQSDEPDFEDGIVRACAERDKVDFILSRDEGAFSKCSIRRLSAKEYVDLFCEVEEVRL